MACAPPLGQSPQKVASISDDESPERVMIDRELRWMLERDGYDLHGIAERLTGQGYGYEPPGSRVKVALEQVGDNVFELVKEGSGPAVMYSAALIGEAYYHGNYLYVRQLLPPSLCAGAIGRRLGDVVSTGMSRLDDRLILEAISRIEPWGPPSPATRLFFAPDIVELGRRLA